MPETPTPSQPPPAVSGGLRASDAEREQVAGLLRDEYVAGRLSHETFVHRMHAVLEARHQSDLPPLVADLPHSRSLARALLGRLRGAWSRMRAGAGAGLRAVPRGAEQPAGTRPPSGSQAPPVPQGRGVTIGMQSAVSERRPLSLRFPRGAGDEFSIGRDANCDLTIPDMTVSRLHATLERTSDGWVLTDHASTNGTRVNGWRVRGKVQVRAGDLVTFGYVETVLVREDDLSPPGGCG